MAIRRGTRRARGRTRDPVQHWTADEDHRQKRDAPVAQDQQSDATLSHYGQASYASDNPVQAASLPAATPLADLDYVSAAHRQHPSYMRSVQHDDLSITAEVSGRLFSSYLTHVHPIWPILYLPMYEQSGYGGPHPVFAQPVLYSIYAIAACNEVSGQAKESSSMPSPALLFESALLAMQRHGSEGQSLSGQFHPLNMLRPSIESCQALVILALQQHGLGEVSNAAILCSIAAGMAIDLRLNEPQAPDAEHTAVEVASRLWWNLFVLDKMLETERGRPIRLRSEDTTTPWPSTAESDEFQLIRVPNTETGTLVTIKTHAMSGFEKTLELAMIIESIAIEICSLRSITKLCKDLDAGEHVRLRLWRRLEDYHTSFGQSTFAIRTASGGFRAVVSPVAIINNMWIWASTIMLNRPFVHYWQELQWSPSDDLNPELHPQRLCLRAADEITAIIEAYRNHLTSFPCDTIFPIVLSAAIIWQFGASLDRQLGTTTSQDKLDLCVRSLTIVEGSWNNAKHYREKLVSEITRSAQTTQADHMENDATATANPSSVLNLVNGGSHDFYPAVSGFRDYLETRLSYLSSPAQVT